MGRKVIVYKKLQGNTITFRPVLFATFYDAFRQSEKPFSLLCKYSRLLANNHLLTNEMETYCSSCLSIAPHAYERSIDKPAMAVHKPVMVYANNAIYFAADFNHPVCVLS